MTEEFGKESTTDNVETDKPEIPVP